MRLRRTVASLSAVAAGATAMTSPAAPAAAAEPAPAPAGDDVTFQVQITEQDLDASGAPVGSARTFDAAGAGAQVQPPYGTPTPRSDRGGGGTSSASGCRRVEMANTVYTSGGNVAYRYVTWLRWCWDRSTGVIDSPSYNHYLRDVSPFHYWRGVVAEDHNLYSWRSGYKKSGFKSFRQGRMENCILKYGCISNTYPSNIIRGHSDGTYSYWVDV